MCLVGKRKLEIFLLTGPVLAVWNPVQEILNQYDKNSRIQVVRLRTADEKRLVGELKFQVLSDAKRQNYSDIHRFLTR